MSVGEKTRQEWSNEASDHRELLVRRINDIRRYELAKAAMQGLLAGRLSKHHTELAADAVRLADALLAELDKPKKEL